MTRLLVIGLLLLLLPVLCGCSTKQSTIYVPEYHSVMKYPPENLLPERMAPVPPWLGTNNEVIEITNGDLRDYIVKLELYVKTLRDDRAAILQWIRQEKQRDVEKKSPEGP